MEHSTHVRVWSGNMLTFLAPLPDHTALVANPVAMAFLNGYMKRFDLTIRDGNRVYVPTLGRYEDVVYFTETVPQDLWADAQRMAFPELCADIEAGMADIEAGRVMTTEELEKRLGILHIVR